MSPTRHLAPIRSRAGVLVALVVFVVGPISFHLRCPGCSVVCVRGPTSSFKVQLTDVFTIIDVFMT